MYIVYRGLHDVCKNVCAIADLQHTLVIYVPPHDLLTILKDAAEVLGESRQCVVARELTKVVMAAWCIQYRLITCQRHCMVTSGIEQVHEEFVRCSLQEAVNKYGETAAKVNQLLSYELLACSENHLIVSQTDFCSDAWHTYSCAG